MDNRLAKRSRVDLSNAGLSVAILDSVNSVRSIVDALEDVQPAPTMSASWRRRLAADELYKIPHTDTPYGLVMVERTIAGKSGEMKIAHVNPFALLQLACQRHKLWAHFSTNLSRESQRSLCGVLS